MAQRIINNLESAVSCRSDINDNFTELYAGIVYDTTPQLGGNLDVLTRTITTSTSNGAIQILPNGTGDAYLGTFRFDADQTIGAGTDNYVLTYDNATGKISLEAATGGAATDQTVIDGSTNPVSGNAVFDALALKANLSGPAIVGSWRFDGGYGDGGIRPYANAGLGYVGFAVHDYYGTSRGKIYATNGGAFLIENASGNILTMASTLEYERFYAMQASGGTATAPLFVLDAASTYEGGFYCPATGGRAAQQIWVSSRLDRLALHRDGIFEVISGKLRLSSLPTSSAGLSSGDVWNDAGTLKIV